ncbi:MAG: hypothetical protein K0R10_269 [Alphaproteobacteria bacterium]|jgi:hypothetical protein|nr:hypothetical protein [Alphaproteobacteria bacterium]
MSQASPTIGANKTGLTYRQEDNDGKKALLSHHKGSTAPDYAEAGAIWLDDSATPWLLKLHDGADWIALGSINASSNAFQPYHGTAALKYLNYAADTGAANAYAVAPVPAISAYAAGQVVVLKPANAATGASTINVNALGTKAIKMQDGSDTPANAMVAGGVFVLVYDGTNFILTNPAITGNYLLARGTAVASAATTDIGAANSDYVEISGTTTITSLGTSTGRNHVWVKFQSVLTLTHNATSLILPSGANITTDTGDVAEFVRVSGGNWQCLAYHPASGKPVAALARLDMPVGAVVQSVAASYTANADLSTTIPSDDTIPQNTEGSEIVTVSITPTSASSTIEVEFRAIGAAAGTVSIIAALFKDSGASALAASAGVAGSISLPGPIGLIYQESAGSTSARTYKIRVGANSGSCRLNGTTSSRLYGGASAATLVVREIKG